MRKILRKTAMLVALFLITSCGAKEKLDDIVDVINVDRKPIDTRIMGVNAFASDGRFGSPAEQFAEVRNTIGLRHVRLLFNWSDGVQGSPGAAFDFSFYDSIVNALPSGIDAIIVLSELPSWMSDSANWIDNNPRKTFAEIYVRAVARRYGSNPRVAAFEVWNEPNRPSVGDNGILQVQDSPQNYVELLGFSYSIIKDLAPSKKVVSAATTAINQNFPESQNYNEEMKNAGAESFCDVWGVHYYGSQFENVVRDGGTQDFLNSISHPIWVTESGAQGVNNQREYVERAWPFLKEKIPGIGLFYYYQFAEATPADVTYGLRNLTAGSTVSDLYIYLRDR